MGLTGFNRVRRLEAEKAAAVKPAVPSPTPAPPPVVETAEPATAVEQAPFVGVMELQQDPEPKKRGRRRRHLPTEGII